MCFSLFVEDHLIVTWLLARQHPLDAAPQRPLHQSDGADQLDELRGLQRGSVVVSFPRLVHGYVTFDDLCSQSDSSNCNTDPRLVARISNRDIWKFLLVFL